MYVIPKERYQALTQSASNQSQSASIQSHSGPSQSHSGPSQSHSGLSISPSSLCPIDGKDFKDPKILTHHLKSHVDGLKCNICGKVLKNKSSLRKHLERHEPQVSPTRSQGRTTRS